MEDHEARREAAIARLKTRRDFRKHVVVYVAVNALLILIWAVTGAGYFWPAWPILGWGVGLALQAWSLRGRRPITEDDIRQEIQRSQA